MVTKTPGEEDVLSHIAAPSAMISDGGRWGEEVLSENLVMLEVWSL